MSVAVILAKDQTPSTPVDKEAKSVRETSSQEVRGYFKKEHSLNKPYQGYEFFINLIYFIYFSFIYLINSINYLNLI